MAGFIKNQLKKLKQLECTLVFYESCHRILASLEDIGSVFGEQEITVARELTKKFEEILRASPKIIQEKLEVNKPRGEFVIVI
jgi:16S rRNA (cytidine1402-2'-O)-methyltransferase